MQLLVASILAVPVLAIANALFAACCRRSDIPEQCMPACDYDRYNSQLVAFSTDHSIHTRRLINQNFQGSIY
ncbi:hypothetical protein Y032_0005g2543 [Ancylostoma ceylanicum]|uniref:Uncharacterized protein n=1 Tax=Ancylostoma ceylanicum TaxID=53326 RepID=A0A016VS63_9BILA|nr:hypothetical protein Y032_0005g2543 [Ancylostoma ceylanicum]